MGRKPPRDPSGELGCRRVPEVKPEPLDLEADAAEEIPVGVGVEGEGGENVLRQMARPEDLEGPGLVLGAQNAASAVGLEPRGDDRGVEDHALHGAARPTSSSIEARAARTDGSAPGPAPPRRSASASCAR